jgi:hypothetical protein
VGAAVTTTDTFMLVRQLLHVLREHDRPMSTQELAALMPWKIEKTGDGGCEWWCHDGQRAGLRVLECHETWHLVAYERTSQGFTGIYRHLRSLERRGLIRRHQASSRRGMLWVLADAAPGKT